MILARVRKVLSRTLLKTSSAASFASSSYSVGGTYRAAAAPPASPSASSTHSTQAESQFDDDLSLPVMRQISHQIDALIAQHHHGQACHSESLVQELIRCAVENNGTDDSFAQRYGGDFALSVAIVAIHYLDRFLQSPKSQSDLTAEEQNYSDEDLSEYFTSVIGVCFMLAMKQLDDNNMLNVDWADVTGVKLRRANSVELDVCKALEWRLVVSREEYQARHQTLVL